MRHTLLLALLLGCPADDATETSSTESQPTATGSDSDDTEPQIPFLAGRDFWPNDISTVDFIADPSKGESGWFASDSIVYHDQVYVFLMLYGQIWLYNYDLTTGELTPAQDEVLMEPEDNEDSPDHLVASNVAAQPCRPFDAVDQPLTADADGVCRLPDLGVNPDTLVLTDADGDEISDYTHVPGHLDEDGTAWDDGVVVETGCEGLTATYQWSTCSMEGEDAYACPVSLEDDAPLGACTWFMLYEGEHKDPEDTDDRSSRYLILANAHNPLTPWVKHTNGDGVLTLEDVRIAVTGKHHPKDTREDTSFASVPDIWFDPTDEVWRVWLTVEAGEASAQFYSESPDDGLTWGIDRHETRIDCYDQEAGDYDPTVCTHVAWEEDAEPPNDPDTPRTPDAVDFAVMDHPLRTEGGNEVAVLITAANSTCSDQPREGAFLFTEHDDGGDMSDGTLYRWVHEVLADDQTGIIVAAHRDGVCDIVLHDFNVSQWDEDKYLMFFTQVPPNGVHVAGSGFACSDYIDDDGDGLVDYGEDPDCESPTDDDESQ